MGILEQSVHILCIYSMSSADGDGGIYLQPRVSGIFRAVEIEIEQEPEYEEITSELPPTLPPRYRRSKSEVVLRQEVEPLVASRQRTRSVEKKILAKRRSDPLSAYYGTRLPNQSPNRKSWHQESKCLRVFEEINGPEGRHSRILYESESRNGLTKSKISLVEEKTKVLAEISVDNLGTEQRGESLPLPQRKENKRRMPKSAIIKFLITIVAVAVVLIVSWLIYKHLGQGSESSDMSSQVSMYTTVNSTLDKYLDE